MTKKTGVIVLMILLACPAAFGEGERRAEADLLGGALLPLTRITLVGRDALAAPGFSVGGRLLGSVAPHLRVGGEVVSLHAGSRSSTALVPNAAAESRFHSVLFLAEAKLAAEEGPVRPFAVLGLGAHTTNVFIELSPAPGQVWANSGTTEARAVVDSNQAGVAATLQGGLELPVNDALHLGLCAAWYYLGQARYPATGLARHTVAGFSGVKGSVSSLALLGELVLRF